ncbi:MAG: YgiT-type zinc finger protein [Chloroflexi bacterium]|nr:YgiT-type zinc finger protein [Chloroflexota bacterium]
MKCNHCGSMMVNASTTFTAVVEGDFYVVQDVPCLQCPVCENTVFEQDVAKKLQLYTSGRVLPARTAQAWVFNWSAPVIHITKTSGVHSTENVPPEFSVLATSNTQGIPDD